MEIQEYTSELLSLKAYGNFLFFRGLWALITCCLAFSGLTVCLATQLKELDDEVGLLTILFFSFSLLIETIASVLNFRLFCV